jgi:hypothetical protein
MKEQENAKTGHFGGDWERTERNGMRLKCAKMGTACG